MKTRDPRRHQPLLRSGTTAFDGAGERLVAGAGAGSSSRCHRPALCHESYLRSSSRNGRVVDLSSGNPEIKITRNVPRTSGVIPPKINRKGTSLFRRLFFFFFLNSCMDFRGLGPTLVPPRILGCPAEQRSGKRLGTREYVRHCGALRSFFVCPNSMILAQKQKVNERVCVPNKSL